MSVSSAPRSAVFCSAFQQARPAPATRQAMHSCARDLAKQAGERLMIRTRSAVAITALLFAGTAHAQQQTPAPPPPDFSNVEIKTTDLGDNVYMLEGQILGSIGGNITVAVASNGIIMV